MCIGYMQILYHFIYWTCASSDFGICRGAETNTLGIQRDDCALRKAPSASPKISSYVFMPRCQPLHFRGVGTIGSNLQQVQNSPLDIHKEIFQWLLLAPGLLLVHILFLR